MAINQATVTSRLLFESGIKPPTEAPEAILELLHEKRGGERASAAVQKLLRSVADASNLPERPDLKTTANLITAGVIASGRETSGVLVHEILERLQARRPRSSFSRCFHQGTLVGLLNAQVFLDKTSEPWPEFETYLPNVLAILATDHTVDHKPIETFEGDLSNAVPQFMKPIGYRADPQFETRKKCVTSLFTHLDRIVHERSTRLSDVAESIVNRFVIGAIVHTNYGDRFQFLINAFSSKK
ncbi:MAG: hypothetical protein K0S38_980 [Candidatus Paceibacter sp.]|nr:hypothetical protein [Candidatus Paceibacter sp.]